MVSVVQYNVLSSGLSSPDYHVGSSPANLDPSFRIQEIFRELQGFMDERAVINLQEISRSWLGKFSDFFAHRKYIMISSSYGFYANDYMGNAIAYPVEIYEATNTTITTVGSKIPTPYVPKRIPTKWEIIRTKIMLILITLGICTKPKDPFDEWTYARNRTNTIILTTLRSLDTNESFVVANYHMPCAYWAPTVLTIHTLESVKIAQKYANGLPLIYAGDFNFTPTSYQYESVTTGKFAPSIQFPNTSVLKSQWDDKIKPMQSAYVTVFGANPQFTVKSKTKDMIEPFIDTLDYIFYSGPCRPVSIREVKFIDNGTESFLPNDYHPSDHLPLFATFELF